MHVGVGQAEMMADLMHQDMGDDLPKRVLVLGPIVEDRAAVEEHHLWERGRVHDALPGEIDAVIKTEQIEGRLDVHRVRAPRRWESRPP